MTDEPRREPGPVPEREGWPRWARLLLIGLAVVALLVVAVLLTGGGHRPRPHGSGLPAVPGTAA